MTRSQTEKLKRLKTHLSKESRNMVMRKQVKRAVMFAGWATVVADALDMNKELLALQNKKAVWK